MREVPTLAWDKPRHCFPSIAPCPFLFHLVIWWSLSVCILFILYLPADSSSESSSFPQVPPRVGERSVQRIFPRKAPVRTAIPPAPNLPCGTVDAVYLWVNGSDPKVVEDMISTGRRVSASRVRDYEVLRYSFRSIQKNAPWIRNIILVTSGELPTWLNRTSERFLHVTHRELFSDPSTLPTFNSNAIETQLVNLPSSTAECIFYLNDDMFFYSPTSLSDYFDQQNDRHLLTFSGFKAPVPQEKMSNLWHRAVSIKSNNLFNAYYYPELEGVHPSTTKELQHHYAGHTCYFYKRSILNTIYQRWKPHFENTARKRYRTGEDVQVPFLYYNVALKEFNATAVKSKHFYATIQNNATKNQRIWGSIKRRQPLCVCLNDGIGQIGDSSKEQKKFNETMRGIIKAFEEWFPEPSMWEKRADVTEDSLVSTQGNAALNHQESFGADDLGIQVGKVKRHFTRTHFAVIAVLLAVAEAVYCGAGMMYRTKQRNQRAALRGIV